MQQKTAKWIWIFPICQALFVLAFFIFILIPAEMPDSAVNATFVIFGLGLVCELISAIILYVLGKRAEKARMPVQAL